jgi:hypothetical protein
MRHSYWQCTMKDDMRISPRFRVSDWRKLDLTMERDWMVAIEIFKDRLEGRFLNFIVLLEKEKYSGFLIMALDCLLVETLQQFSLGMQETPRNKVKEYFISFLTEGRLRRFFNEDMAGLFYYQVRNGILHQAEIKGSSRVLTNREFPLVRYSNDNDGIIINRRLFHRQLVLAYEDYVIRLKNPREKKLRNNFQRKMNYICQVPSIY